VDGELHVDQEMCYLNTNRINITCKVHNCGCCNCVDMPSDAASFMDKMLFCA